MKIGKIKRVITAAAICTSLAGCSFSEIAGLPPEPQITSAYTAECTVTSYIVPPDSEEETQFCFGGKIKRLGTGFWELEITSPETVAGLKITASDDTVDSSLGELSFSLPLEHIPEASPFTAIFGALDSAAVNGRSLSSGEEGGWVMSSDTYTIIFDGSGTPVSMAMSNPRMTVEFESFRIMSDTLGSSGGSAV